MIKVTIGGEPQKENGINYPCLMISNLNNQLLVLFEKEDCGTVIVADEKNHVGKYQDDWNMEKFRQLTEPITLQNITE